MLHLTTIATALLMLVTPVSAATSPSELQDLVTQMMFPHSPTPEVRKLYRDMNAEEREVMGVVFRGIILHCMFKHKPKTPEEEALASRCRLDQSAASQFMMANEIKFVKNGETNSPTYRRHISCFKRHISAINGDWIRAKQCYEQNE